MEVQDIINLVVNGGGSAVLLYLLLREQQRGERIEQKLYEVLQELAENRKQVTQEVKRLAAGNENRLGKG